MYVTAEQWNGMEGRKALYLYKKSFCKNMTADKYFSPTGI